MKLKKNERVLLCRFMTVALEAVFAMLLVLCLTAPVRAVQGTPSAWAAQTWAGLRVLLISSYHSGSPAFSHQGEGNGGNRYVFDAHALKLINLDPDNPPG
ncbi:MAG TPA: hypothetical protein VKA04_04780, partial [Pseudodesulfovibrio sp.]|nr:hypothetical protein [Pseudodesulfovibrio sp.]